MNWKKLIGSTVVMVVIVSILISAGFVDKDKSVAAADGAESENLIILIGDGMGPAQVTLSRIYGQKYLNQEQLNLDEILVGTNTTYAGYSGDQSGIVTDSAASATAFGAGVKTYNGAIAVTNEEVAMPVASVLEAAEDMGKSTGLISTARITHATPAAYASHVRDRNNENAVASQYLTAGVDVLLGGGERSFVSDADSSEFGAAKRDDGLNITDMFVDKGYSVAYDKAGLEAASGDKLIGFFGDSHVAYNLDRDVETPNLADQLTKAIEILERNEEGFVIMLEGGRIDHAGHANDLHSVAKETIEFDQAVKVALDYAKEKGNTSVMATADHETGGLTIGSQNTYDAYFDIFEEITASSEKIGGELADAETDDEVRTIVAKYTSIDDLTEDEINLIQSGNLRDGSASSYGKEGSFNAVISHRSLLGWTGHGHTGVDVNVYAYGPVANYLKGNTDNTDFAKAGAKVIGANLDTTTAKLQEKYLYPKFLINRDGEVLFPGLNLGEALGVDVTWNASAGVVEFNGSAGSFEMNPFDEQVDINGQKYTATNDNDSIYLPLEAFESLTGKDYTWDTLSERIVK